MTSCALLEEVAVVGSSGQGIVMVWQGTSKALGQQGGHCSGLLHQQLCWSPQRIPLDFKLSAHTSALATGSAMLKLPGLQLVLPAL